VQDYLSILSCICLRGSFPCTNNLSLFGDYVIDGISIMCISIVLGVIVT
jgi:hypothetical protein